ncbi:NUDIX domain-containing protein [Sediminibacterium sp.]|uniref:NUDIX hydrolase n=1 Tax=Sediminibacterium sp. TaxID=1917865 RepID=UPI002600DF49|nr:NUDIX domain-containing protein [Sediminibacterium sp.]MBW0178324.1 NUDIX domain-containing protein [Sediminibacterium sp.]
MDRKTIIAAGGLVYNEKDELLMIFRRGKWDLPKGKLDDGETIEDCAIREVMEETGLTTVIRGNLIGITYHQYFDQWLKEEVIKESHWYRMEAPGNQKLIPQTEEDIEIIKWVSEKELDEYLENSYDNIVEIVRKA